MSTLISPENLLQHMTVKANPPVYQIGCLERRVTLYSQQVRALNLVFALFDQKRLAPDGRVMVVGGGAAGLTVAAALADRGADVTLLERLDTLMPFQSGNVTRWLHPHIYEWPDPGCRNAEAGLPLMNWSADYAAKVAETLREEFYRHVRGKKVKIETGARNVKLRPGGNPRLEWNEARGRFRSEPFDILVLAVGFGLERSSLGTVPSYWRNDDFAQPELDAGRKRHYLISGCGDGGLVDLLRIRLRDFRHDRLLEDFVSLESHLERKLSDNLLRIEEAARQIAARGKDPADFLYDEYQRLRPDYVDKKIAGRLRQDTFATLNGAGDFPWNLYTSILNRFLASALIGLHGESVGADWWRGRIAQIKQVNTSYVVRLDDDESRRFDSVIIRHGPEPVLTQWLSKEDSKFLRFRNVLDQTRSPLWPDGYFNRDATRQSIRRSAKRVIEVLIPLVGRGGVGKLVLDLDDYDVSTFEELADFVYFNLKNVEAYTYGKAWRLLNMVTGQELKHARESNEYSQFDGYVPDPRSLEQVDILPGDTLEVVFIGS